MDHQAGTVSFPARLVVWSVEKENKNIVIFERSDDQGRPRILKSKMIFFFDFLIIRLSLEKSNQSVAILVVSSKIITLRKKYV